MEQDTSQNPSSSEIQNEILQAALKLFAKHGYFNTSLTDIAQAAGLKTVTHLYQHFDDKQKIAHRLHESILDCLNISIDDIRRKTPKSSEQLRGVVDLFFKLTEEAPQVIQFLLFMRSCEFLPEPKPLHESSAFNKILKIIQGGIRSGEIRNIDPLLANTYFFGIINNTLHMILTGELDKKADAYQSQTWLTAWNVIAKKSTCF
jgi:AcrR family transcriptional regulator